MKKLFVLATASLVLVSSVSAQFATSVVSYDKGLGSSSGFTNTSVVLGEPSRINPFTEPTDVFDPPYGKNQILSVGEGGSLVVQFAKPILNHPKNRFGIDFMIFGNAGFIITNDFDLNTFSWVGTPATDGSLFAANDGVTRVSVSEDGTNFFQLDPNLAPTVDGLFPTDGAGDFHTPVDPTLTQGDFAGLTFDQIRAFYYGSGGGTGYDITWARNAQGRKVHLGSVSFVRIDVLSGKSEIDAVSAVFLPGKPGKGKN
ncbi:MAG: hypothetical protein JWM68_1823 [Verrucomicrobiales bacterium]|nr:hypothetical protein [Verrucomicrobiales bacterium]